MAVSGHLERWHGMTLQSKIKILLYSAELYSLGAICDPRGGGEEGGYPFRALEDAGVR